MQDNCTYCKPIPLTIIIPIIYTAFLNNKFKVANLFTNHLKSTNNINSILWNEFSSYITLYDGVRENYWAKEFDLVKILTMEEIKGISKNEFDYLNYLEALAIKYNKKQPRILKELRKNGALTSIEYINYLSKTLPNINKSNIKYFDINCLYNEIESINKKFFVFIDEYSLNKNYEIYIQSLLESLSYSGNYNIFYNVNGEQPSSVKVTIYENEGLIEWEIDTAALEKQNGKISSEAIQTKVKWVFFKEQMCSQVCQLMFQIRDHVQANNPTNNGNFYHKNYENLEDIWLNYSLKFSDLYNKCRF